MTTTNNNTTLLTMSPIKIDWNDVMDKTEAVSNPLSVLTKDDDDCDFNSDWCLVTDIIKHAIKDKGFDWNGMNYGCKADRYDVKFNKKTKILTLYNIEVDMPNEHLKNSN